MNENLLSAMEKRLTPEYEKMLKNIHAPKEVLIPPQDARQSAAPGLPSPPKSSDEDFLCVL